MCPTLNDRGYDCSVFAFTDDFDFGNNIDFGHVYQSVCCISITWCVSLLVDRRARVAKFYCQCGDAYRFTNIKIFYI